MPPENPAFTPGGHNSALASKPLTENHFQSLDVLRRGLVEVEPLWPWAQVGFDFAIYLSCVISDKSLNLQIWFPHGYKNGDIARLL